MQLKLKRKEIQEQKIAAQQAEGYRSTISHELRTPIQGSIIILVDLICRTRTKDSKIPSDFEHALILVRDQLCFMESFVEDLLNYRLLKDGILTLDFKAFSPVTALDFVVNMFKKRTDSR